MRPERHVAFVGLGSNLGDSLGELKTACSELAMLHETTLNGCSAVYRSAPLGVAPQPDFLNACCRVTTGLGAQSLLAELMRIEQLRGRTRSEKGAPRVLDLDLLLYDDLICEDPGLTLPHPRLHERAFVLYPLADLNATILVPGRGSVRVLMKRCADQRIERLADTWFHVPAHGTDYDERAHGA